MKMMRCVVAAGVVLMVASVVTAADVRSTGDAGNDWKDPANWGGRDPGRNTGDTYVISSGHTLGPKELERVCRGGPEIVFVGTGHSGQLTLADDVNGFLTPRRIECQALPTPDAIAAYNQCDRRKAALIHVTC